MKKKDRPYQVESREIGLKWWNNHFEQSTTAFKELVIESVKSKVEGTNHRVFLSLSRLALEVKVIWISPTRIQFGLTHAVSLLDIERAGVPVDAMVLTAIRRDLAKALETHEA